MDEGCTQFRKMAKVTRAVAAGIAAAQLALLVACPGMAAARQEYGRAVEIHVSVLDEKKQPVMQARAEVHRQGRVVASGTTDAAGRMSLTVSGAGSYRLSISKKGYFKTEVTVEITPDGPAPEVDAVLPRHELSEQSITVQGTAANPVTESSASQSTLAPEQAKNVPFKPATLTDALPLVPGVVRVKDGSLSIAGYGENHSALLVNSVNVTDPATGSFGVSVPIDSVETISVSEMPYLAQYGRFTAGVVAAETRRGGDKWDFSVNDPLPEFRIRSGHLAGLRSATPRVNFGGPLIANHLYFLEGMEYLLDKHEVRTLPFGANEMRSTAFNSFTQADWIVSNRQVLTASYHFAPHSLRHAGLDFFDPQPVTPDANFHESTTTITDRLSLGEGVLQSTFAYTHVGSTVHPQGTAAMILTPLGNRGNYYSQQDRDATRFEWIEKWTLRAMHFHGSHTLQFGSVFGHSENEGQFNASPVLLQNAAGRLLERIDFRDRKPYNVSDYEPAVYIQDHWVLNPRFALEAGIRVEGQTISSTVRTAPRGGFVWTPDADGKTVIRGGAGVFYDSVPLDVYAFRRYPQQIVTTFDATGAVIGEPIRYINVLDRVVKSKAHLVSRGGHYGNFAPFSIAGDLEIERTVSRQFSFRVRYLQSLAEDRITIRPEVNQGVHALVLGSSGSARTRQYEFTARIGANSQRQFFASYVRQYARGDLTDGSEYLGDFPFPIVRQNVIASLPGEIPNRFLFWGTYALPQKFRLMPHIEFRNGFPYQNTNEFQQYVPAIGGSQQRFPAYFSFDLRGSKDVSISPKHAVRFSATLRNLTNHFNPLEVHSNIADPLHGVYFGNLRSRLLLDFDFLY